MTARHIIPLYYRRNLRRCQKRMPLSLRHRLLLLATLWLAMLNNTVCAQIYFGSSVTTNDIDYLSHADANAFHCLDYDGPATIEMVMQREEAEVDNVEVFFARFVDGSVVEIQIHPDAASNATQLATQLTRPLGTLPTWMRVPQLVVKVNPGNRPAFAESLGRFFVVSAENMAQRIATNDLQETVFHEMVHVVLDLEHAASIEWQQAQVADGTFVTGYAKKHPQREDLAETALLVYTWLHYPQRLPEQIRQTLPDRFSHRIDYLTPLLSDNDSGANGRLQPGPCRT